MGAAGLASETGHSLGCWKEGLSVVSDPRERRSKLLCPL